MIAFWLSCLVASQGPPPVLLEPQAALAWAQKNPGLTAAEIALLARQPQQALALLPPGEGPRHLKLQAEAYAALGQRGRAEERIAQLSAIPGWRVPALVVERGLQMASFRHFIARIGLFSYAICLGVLALLGARELLRPRPETFAMLLGTALGAALAALGHPALLTLVAFLGLSATVLVHAAGAVIARAAPGPRGRLLVATVVWLGAGGVLAAIFGQVEPGGWLLILA